MGKQLNYAQQRIKDMGFQDEPISSYWADIDSNDSIGHPEIWSNKKGDLCIGYVDMYSRELYTYDPGVKSNKESLSGKRSGKPLKPFHSIRFSKPEEHEGNRYMVCQADHGSRPMIPRKMREKFHEKSKIKILLITEGPLKAHVGAHFGLDIVGVPNITTFRKKGTVTIFKEIGDIIKVCKVEKVIWLVDGDLFEVKWSETKDLRLRAFNFQNSFSMVRDLTRPWKVDIYAGWITAKQKGLDDLLLAHKNDKKKIASIIRAAKSVANRSTYFEKIDIQSKSDKELRKLFHIDSVESFYEYYKMSIGDFHFVYNKNQYKLDHDFIPPRLRIHQSEQAAKYVIVNDQLFRKGTKKVRKKYEPGLWPVKSKFLNKYLKVANVKKEIDKIVDQMDYYDLFMNAPGHGIDFVQVDKHTNEEGIETTSYNKYFPVNHTLRKGDITNSKKLIKHIFGDKEIEYKGRKIKTWELGMDYMKILWCNPTQILPILCLISKERGTGKTTFCNWQNAIFQQNVREITTQDLDGNFNSHHLTALINYIEEADIDKKSLVQALKKMSTQKRAKLNAKYEGEVEVDFYTKFIILSNKVKNFIQIDEEEIRFWIHTIPELEEDDIDFLSKLESEIGAFIWYLINEYKFASENVTRHWFADELLETESLRLIKKESAYGEQKVLQDHLKEQFDLYEVGVLKYSIPQIMHKMFKDDNMTQKYMRDILEHKMSLQKWKGSHFYHIFSISVNDSYEGETQTTNRSSKLEKSNPYIFYVNDFWAHTEYTEFLTSDALIELEKEQEAQQAKSIKKPEFKTCDTWWDTLTTPEKVSLRFFKSLREETDGELQLKVWIEKGKSFQETISATNKLTEKKFQATEATPF